MRIAFTENSVSFYRGKKRIYREHFVPVDIFAGAVTGTDKRTTELSRLARKVILRALRTRQLWAIHQWRLQCYRAERPACLDWSPRVHFALLPVVAKIDIKSLNEMLTVRPSGEPNAES